MKPFSLDTISGPHEGQPVLTEGPSPDSAAGAIILLHGRGAGAQDIFSVGRIITERLQRRDILLLAPHASRATWYPYRFIEPEENNQPWLDSARAAVAYLIDHIVVDGGMDPRKVFLMGFSQGACLAADVAATRGTPLGGIYLFSGGLIGPEGTDFAFSGDLDQTPVFVGCSDDDPHIPLKRVQETAATFRSLHADVDEQIYPGMGHTIIEDELARVLRSLETRIQ